MIRNNENKIENWIINKLPITFQERFTKETIGDVVVRQVIFTTENTGLAIVDNYPEGKTSLYYFNIAGRYQQSSSLVNSFSLYTTLLVEPLNRQWCLFNNKEKRMDIGKLTKEGNIESGIPVGIIGQTSEGLTI